MGGVGSKGGLIYSSGLNRVITANWGTIRRDSKEYSQKEQDQ